MPALYTLNTQTLPSLSAENIHLILLQCLYLLEDPEMSVRVAVLDTFSRLYSYLDSEDTSALLAELLPFVSGGLVHLLS